MYRVFIVEDDLGIAAAIEKRCIVWGYHIRSVRDYQHVLTEFLEFQPHLVIMDISLPFYDGYYWCREIRKVSSTPILFISSASDRMNMIMAMNMGADDFVAKPFDQDVFVAKMQALLRRTYAFSTGTQIKEIHGAVLDTGNQSVLFQDRKIPLSRNEYLIFQILVENKGKVVSREKLMQVLWKTDVYVDDNTLSVNVNRLRKKLEQAGLKDLIQTRFGVGYLVEE